MDFVGPILHSQEMLPTAKYAQRYNNKITTGDLKQPEAALIAIGRYSLTLETVDVGWCKEITDRGATQIAQRSKSLRYLGLMRCDQLLYKINDVDAEMKFYYLIRWSREIRLMK
ncbi:hypothetical protein WISP_61138 [Willisornis vidua]|uniref:ATP synthase subunit s, mitochondrial n=1 Tax=Willisornis vidua TaxID=1566151 RepID=A0ABQ9DGL7_9PASS|nr:hypothetical protein WISP_61138 [Willisornis vidua]